MYAVFKIRNMQKKGAREVPVSPLYSNLKEAEQYRELARKAGTGGLIIKQRKWEVDGLGNPVLRGTTKKPVLYWEDVGV